MPEDNAAKPTKKSSKEMNRGLVVLGAILIQLALGAIYAWSVFTPGLTMPLVDDDFQQMDVMDTIMLDLNATDLTIGENSTITMEFISPTNTPITTMDNIVVTTELRDADNDLISEHETYNATFNTTTQMYEATVNLDEPGNWHFVVAAEDAGTPLSGDYDILVSEGTGKFGYSTVDTQIIFSVGLVTFATVMIIAGRLQAKTGPRKIALIGGLLLGAGYMAASFVGFGASSFIPMLITVGLIGGAGIGMAYVVPIAVGIKWFPDRKGLISGLAVAGFGFGATIWVKLAGNWGNLLANEGIHDTFFMYGLFFMAMVVIGAFFMVNPPAGYAPKGWTPPAKKEGGPSGYNFMPKQMLKTPQFWMIWSMFVSGALAGLMVIGVIKLYGIDALVDSGNYTVAEASAIAGTAMAVFYAIFNGIGRIAWGAISDKIGYKKALMTMFIFQAIMMFVVFSMGGNEYTLYVAAALIGFNFGGNFALFPTASADLFGSKNVGQNYGFVFSSYGVGGVVGPLMAGYFKDSAGDVTGWYPAFIIAGILCVVAVVLAAMIKHPKDPTEAEETDEEKKETTEEEAPAAEEEAPVVEEAPVEETSSEAPVEAPAPVAAPAPTEPVVEPTPAPVPAPVPETPVAPATPTPEATSEAPSVGENK